MPDNWKLSVASLRATYRLKRFRSSRDPDFAAALLLYVRNTASAVRTDTNEITYWLDHFFAKFGNPFYVFGFYRDRQLVGYAEAAYLQNDRLLVFDYLVIDEIHRRNNVFFEFIDHLKRYFEESHPDYRYAVLEVAYGVGQTHPSQAACLLIRLFKMQGFRIVCAPYCQPRLTLDDAESEIRADLLIYSTNHFEQLRTDTYLSVVHAIYYQYYLPWKSIFPTSQDKYRHYIDTLYDSLRKPVERMAVIAVNGHNLVLNAPAARPLLTNHRIIIFTIQSLLVVVLLTAAMIGLKVAFHMSDLSFGIVYGIALTSFVAMAAIMSSEARVVLVELVSLIKHLFPSGLTPFISPGQIPASKRVRRNRGQAKTSKLNDPPGA